jgi:uncharacterized protein (UPF0332 family)
MDLRQAKEEGLLIDLRRDENTSELSEKEMGAAEFDLNEAKEGLNKGKTKWTIVQAYYAAFHAARALMFKFRLKELKHEGIIVFLEDRVKVGKLKPEFLTIFKSLKSGREDSNYETEFSTDRTKRAVEGADEFVKAVKNLLKER